MFATLSSRVFGSHGPVAPGQLSSDGLRSEGVRYRIGSSLIFADISVSSRLRHGSTKGWKLVRKDRNEHNKTLPYDRGKLGSAHESMRFPHPHTIQTIYTAVAGSLVGLASDVEELADPRLSRRWAGRSRMRSRRCCAVDFHAFAAELFHEDGPEVLQI